MRTPTLEPVAPPAPLVLTDVTGAQHRLTPGVIDDAARQAFTRGHCAELALALHDRTGWPLRILVSTVVDFVSLLDNPVVMAAARRGEMIPSPYLHALWAHVLVQRPDGLLVDIIGARTMDAVSDEYDHNGSGDGTADIYHGAYRHRLLAATRDDVDGLTSTAPRHRGAGTDFVDAVLAIPDPQPTAWPWHDSISEYLRETAHDVADLDYELDLCAEIEELRDADLLDEALRRGLVPAVLLAAATAPAPR